MGYKEISVIVMIGLAVISLCVVAIDYYIERRRYLKALNSIFIGNEYTVAPKGFPHKDNPFNEISPNMVAKVIDLRKNGEGELYVKYEVTKPEEGKRKTYINSTSFDVFYRCYIEPSNGRQ